MPIFKLVAANKKLFFATTFTAVNLVVISKFYSGNLTLLPSGKKDNSSLKPLEPFDWSGVMKVPPGLGNSGIGNQVLHFKSTNKPYEDDPEAQAFVTKYFTIDRARVLESDADCLRFASDSVLVKEGFYLEMGVATGRSINFIAALNPKKSIYGFDSFEGLPEDWLRRDKIMEVGTFGLKEVSNNKSPVPVLNNVTLYKGWFKDVLPNFKKEVLKDSQIAFLHIDSDIYNSAKEVLTILKDNIGPGTIMVFDELYNYPGYERHEWKALTEFAKEPGRKIHFIAYNKLHEQAVVLVVE